MNLKKYLILLSIALVIFVTFTGCHDKQTTDLLRSTVEYELKSVSKIPPSKIFPPDATKFYALPVAGSTSSISRGKEIRTVELRGWLRTVSAQSNCKDPDWHYDLEVDPAWTDTLKMDLNQLIKLGNLIEFQYDRIDTGSWYNLVVMPAIHIELNGWRQSQQGNEAVPADWGSSNIDPNCNDVLWPYNPVKPLSWQPDLVAGQYVRIVGSVVTDIPHSEEAKFPTWTCKNLGFLCNDYEKAQSNAVKKSWAGGKSENDPNNPARWTEIHPPDIIAILPDKPRTETLRGVAVYSDNCMIGPCAGMSTNIDIYPPGPKPSSTSTVGVKELVGPETNYKTIIEGNANLNGGKITIFPDHVHIDVKVRGEGGWGVPGKFKAIYRVFWQ